MYCSLDLAMGALGEHPLFLCCSLDGHWQGTFTRQIFGKQSMPALTLGTNVNRKLNRNNARQTNV